MIEKPVSQLLQDFSQNDPFESAKSKESHFFLTSLDSSFVSPTWRPSTVDVLKTFYATIRGPVMTKMGLGEINSDDTLEGLETLIGNFDGYYDTILEGIEKGIRALDGVDDHYVMHQEDSDEDESDEDGACAEETEAEGENEGDYGKEEGERSQDQGLSVILESNEGPSLDDSPRTPVASSSATGAQARKPKRRPEAANLDDSEDSSDHELPQYRGKIPRNSVRSRPFTRRSRRFEA